MDNWNKSMHTVRCMMASNLFSLKRNAYRYHFFFSKESWGQASPSVVDSIQAVLNPQVHLNRHQVVAGDKHKSRRLKCTKHYCTVLDERQISLSTSAARPLWCRTVVSQASTVHCRLELL